MVALGALTPVAGTLVEAGRRLAEEDAQAQETLQQRGRFVRDAEAPERDPVATPA